MICTRLNGTAGILFVAIQSLCVTCAFAQPREGHETVLRADQVTESALIQSLAPHDPAQPVAPRTRGFRPAAPPESASSSGSGGGKANLLMTFKTDSAQLTGETKKMLDTLARALQSDTLAANTFRIEGHADPRGNSENNRALSQARAEAVTSYLVTKHSIVSDRLVAVGKGSSEPLNKERDDAPENRRVTVVNVK